MQVGNVPPVGVGGAGGVSGSGGVPDDAVKAAEDLGKQIATLAQAMQDFRDHKINMDQLLKIQQTVGGQINHDLDTLRQTKGLPEDIYREIDQLASDIKSVFERIEEISPAKMATLSFEAGALYGELKRL